MLPLGEQFARLVPSLRSQFPQIETLRDGQRRIYLDNAAGTLVPQTVADALADAALWSNPQPGRGWPGSEETSRQQARARRLLGVFLNASPEDRLYLSESTTASLYKLREALEPSWESTDNVVVTDCDHFANISPWEWRARWQVRRARMLPDGQLDLEHFAGQLDPNTRVAALTLASNGLGTVIRAEEAVALVRERAPRAVVVVDAVHGAPHLPMDVRRLAPDALAFSTYKLFGPLCGVLWLRADLAPRLSPFHVEPHTDPETLLEWGTLNGVTVSGICAALGYLHRLGERLEPALMGELTEYPREHRLFKAALVGIRAYEAMLSRHVLEGLQGSERVRLFGVREPERAGERVPTFAFTLAGTEDGDLERSFWERAGIQLAGGSHYSAAVLRGLGRAGVGRASFAHYNTLQEADAFIAAAK